jgi:hypothetical protein
MSTDVRLEVNRFDLESTILPSEIRGSCTNDVLLGYVSMSMLKEGRQFLVESVS